MTTWHSCHVLAVCQPTEHPFIADEECECAESSHGRRLVSLQRKGKNVVTVYVRMVNILIHRHCIFMSPFYVFGILVMQSDDLNSILFLFSFFFDQHHDSVI